MGRHTLTDEERVIRYFKSAPHKQAMFMLRICRAVVQDEGEESETAAPKKRAGRSKKDPPSPDPEATL